MVVRVIQIARLLIILASRHRSLVLENLALRQQLAVHHRTRPKPTVRWSDRLFWVGLRLAWPDWKSALVIVRPATVIAWHRRGFAWYWTRRSRPRGGRPQAGADVRRVLREMALANPVVFNDSADPPYCPRLWPNGCARLTSVVTPLARSSSTNLQQTTEPRRRQIRPARRQSALT
jgi:hypothetical protein